MTTPSSSSPARPRLLFASSEEGSWMDRDEEGLTDTFEIHRQRLSLRKPRLWSLWKAVQRSELVYVWFGSLATIPLVLFTRILGRPLVLVAGGYDVAALPEFHHGAFTKSPLSKILRRWIFRQADQVLAVSKSSLEEAVQNAKIPREKINLLPLGFSPLLKEDQILPWEKRKNQVVCLSSLMGDYYRIKGIDRMVRLARACPEISFLLIGSMDEKNRFLLEGTPSNFHKMGYVPYASAEFLKILNESKIVLQLSLYESFGAAVVDGALCGCYPLTSDAKALADLTSKIGTSLGPDDPADKILRDLLSSKQDSLMIAESFLNTYSLEKRLRDLKKILTGALSK